MKLSLYVALIAAWLHAEARASQRIVSLVPSLAEIAAEEIAEANTAADMKIVGVSEYSDRPLTIVTGLRDGSIKSVGPYFKPNLEIILSLKPTVVLATKDGTPRVVTEQISAQKIGVTLVSGDRLEDIPESYRKVGSALGIAETGKKIADKFLVDWAELIAQVKKSNCRARVAMLFFDASSTSLIVVGAKTFLGDLVEGAGFTNAYADGKIRDRYPRVAKEDLLARKLDLLLVFASEADPEAAIKKFVENLQWKAPWIALHDSALQRPTRGVIAPLRKLREESCRMIGKNP